MSFLLRTRRTVALGLTLLVIAAGGAHASNWGSQGSVGSSGTTNDVFLQPSRNVTACSSRLSTTWHSQLSSVVQFQYDATDLSVGVRRIEAPALCPIEDRINVYVANYGDNGLRGWNACYNGASGAHPNMTCPKQYVRVNTNYVPLPERRIFCHEIGHSMGLRHTQEQASCLMQTADGGTSALTSSHDRGHLNDRY